MIKKVKKGDQLSENFIANKDGYVWCDEVEQLGIEKVYKNKKKAKLAQQLYVDCLEEDYAREWMR